MPTQSMPMSMPVNNYDARWFIWTIVFLVVTGISLVSYIALSDTGLADDSVGVTTHTTHKTVKK
jgi:hypothetical protein